MNTLQSKTIDCLVWDRDELIKWFETIKNPLLCDAIQSQIDELNDLIELILDDEIKH